MFKQYSKRGSNGRNIPGVEQLQNQIFPVLETLIQKEWLWAYTYQ